MKEFALLVNGALIYKQEQLEVINPATEQVFASAPRANEDDLNQAVVAARSAANAWALTDDADFYQAKISSAVFYIEHVLPRSKALVDTVLAGASSTMAIPVDQL